MSNKKILKPNKIQKNTQDVIRDILEVVPIGVYIVNKKGCVDYVNAPMIVISGDTHDQFKSINVFELDSYKNIGLDKKIREVFEGSSFAMKSVPYTSYYSKKFTYRNIIGIPILEKGEKKALIFIEDITAAKKAEEERKRIMNMKSEFISMVSHELRTPLSVIKEYVDIVQDESMGPLNKQQKEFLTTAKQNIARLTRLINDVLDYQKLEAGRMQFALEEGDINLLIEQIARDISPLIKNKGLKSVLRLAKDLPKITFDKDRITQILTNLINNAVKFTDKGSIAIETSKLENAVCVSVSDTGKGIKKEDLGKLFKSFSQVGKEKGDAVEGTGLGLIISKKIIQGLGGKIEAQSEYGKGSTFQFFLPIEERRG